MQIEPLGHCGLRDAIAPPLSTPEGGLAAFLAVLSAGSVACPAGAEPLAPPSEGAEGEGESVSDAATPPPDSDAPPDVPAQRRLAAQQARAGFYVGQDVGVVPRAGSVDKAGAHAGGDIRLPIPASAKGGGPTAHITEGSQAGLAACGGALVTDGPPLPDTAPLGDTISAGAVPAEAIVRLPVGPVAGGGPHGGPIAVGDQSHRPRPSAQGLAATIKAESAPSARAGMVAPITIADSEPPAVVPKTETITPTAPLPDLSASADSTDTVLPVADDRPTRTADVTVTPLRQGGFAGPARLDPAVMAMFRDAALAAAVDGGRVIELDTGSEQVGKLGLSIQSQDGVLQVTLLSGRPDTLELLRRSIAVFLRDLSEQGFRDVDLRLGPLAARRIGRASGRSGSFARDQPRP
jgi:collagen type IV alpha